MGEGKLAEVRNRKIGFVFQFFNLIQTLTAVENVELPVQFSSNGRSGSRSRAEDLLKLVGLGHRLKHRPNQLSGGEQQRVAIARALANSPDLILADEPTGNLDTGIGKAVLDALLDARSQTGTTLVLVTHDADVAWPIVSLPCATERWWTNAWMRSSQSRPLLDSHRISDRVSVILRSR